MFPGTEFNKVFVNYIIHPILQLPYFKINVFLRKVALSWGSLLLLPLMIWITSPVKKMYNLSDLADLTSYQFFLWIIFTSDWARCKSSYYILGTGTVLFLVMSTRKDWSYTREKNLNLGYQLLPVIPEYLNELTWLASLSCTVNFVSPSVYMFFYLSALQSSDCPL